MHDENKGHRAKDNRKENREKEATIDLIYHVVLDSFALGVKDPGLLATELASGATDHLQQIPTQNKQKKTGLIFSVHKYNRERHILRVMEHGKKGS